MMATATGLLTAEDFAALPHDSLRLELVRGEIRARAPGFGDHGVAVMQISYPIAQHIYMRKLGCVYATGTGFLLSRNPDTVRAPDCAFIQASRVTPAATAAFWNPVIPDLVFEVVSSGDRPKAVAEKVSMWLDAGVRLVWVVYPTRREVVAHRLGQPEATLTERNTLDGLDVIPGFTLPIADIFD